VQAQFAAAFLIGHVGGAGLVSAADLGERIRQGLLCII
jgi:hypothetical protein